MRGRDTETNKCLREIGESVGFEVPAIGVRHLDRNKRMLPAGMKIDQDSQIQQRMHTEFVIGFYKPPVSEMGNEESETLVKMMIEGRRLRDVSDLPFDLAV